MMDPAAYTLIGALVGIIISQISNYFLENKKSQNQKDLKLMELQHTKSHELHKERRLAYAKYLEAVDQAAASIPTNIGVCIAPFYTAIIIASNETSSKITAVLSHLRESELKPEEFMKSKKELLKAMQSDLQN